MGKPLVFAYGNANVTFDPVKIDRSVLYGFKEVEVLDEQGHRCELATLADDGKTVVGHGGVTYAYLSPDGAWRDKAGLNRSMPRGRRSSQLPRRSARRCAHGGEGVARRVSLAQCSQRLPHAERRKRAELSAELRGGTIFKFPYSFRGGLEADAGFLLAGGDGNVYLAVATPTKIEFVGLPAGCRHGGGRERAKTKPICLISTWSEPLIERDNYGRDKYRQQCRTRRRRRHAKREVLAAGPLAGCPRPPGAVRASFKSPIDRDTGALQSQCGGLGKVSEAIIEGRSGNRLPN